MTHGQTGRVPAAVKGDGLPTAIASLAVGAAFFGLWFWLLPQWLGSALKRQARPIGDGWVRFRRCWDSPLPCAFAHPLALTFPDTSLLIKVVKRLERKIDERLRSSTSRIAANR